MHWTSKKLQIAPTMEERLSRGVPFFYYKGKRAVGFRSSKTHLSSDVRHSVSATYTLPVESTNRLDEIVESALNNCGREVLPLIDEGFMQVRTIEDLDGHIWAFIYLDTDKFNKIKSKRN